MEMREPYTIDQLFLRIALKDDEQAFRKLFFDFFSPLCVFAHRYVENRDVCEDIVQDTFLKIWKNRKRLEINTSGRNFLITSVRNSCVDYLRRKDLENSRFTELKEKFTLSSPDDLYSTIELEEMLGKALNRLPEKIRIVFEKNRFEGMTYNEIAAEQNISVKTVEAYMTKALKQLRIEFKDYLPVILLFLS